MELREIVSRVFEDLNMLRRLLGEGLWDPIREAALRWLLYSVHQCVLDLLAALIAELGLRKPPTYAELATPLYDHGLVDEGFREVIRVIARNRNVLAHSYRRLGREDLMRIANYIVREAPRVVSRIVEIMESRNLDPAQYEVDELMRVVAKVVRDDERVIAVILFGSRARGNHRDESDYDLAIISSKPLDLEELNGIAMRISSATGIPVDRIDVVDLSNAPNSLVYKVLRDGKLLYIRDENLYRRWVRWNYIRILDEEDLMDTYYRRMCAKLRRLET